MIREGKKDRFIKDEADMLEVLESTGMEKFLAQGIVDQKPEGVEWTSITEMMVRQTASVMGYHKGFAEYLESLEVTEEDIDAILPGKAD